jgi:hypothetical protein
MFVSTHPRAPKAANQTTETLLFMLSDFADSAFYERESIEEEMTEEERDDLECSCEFDDSDPPLGGNLFRALAPISVTPFGPLGPGLSLGQT